MNIVVVGLGSMGRRRVRLIKKTYPNFNVVGIDSRLERREQAERELEIETSQSLEETLKQFKPECAIVSTSPLSHASIIEMCLRYDCNVFTELNLVLDKYESNMDLAREKNKVLFLSSTCLYREEIQYIDRIVNDTVGTKNYNYHVGQYLPDWHPWETITDFFVGDKKTNGCRELMAIELPWLIKTFGDIVSFEVISCKTTTLPIQYNDTYLLLLEHEGGNRGLLAVDVVSRKAVRNLEIYGENIYLTWDGTPEGLRQFDYINKKEETIRFYDFVDKQEGYASFIIENGYQNELDTFFDLVKGKGKPRYTFQDDFNTLKLIDKIEEK